MMLMEPLKQVTTRKAVKEALCESGMKQSELAEKLGITQASVSGNINRSKMSVDVLVTMMEAMGFSVVVGKKDGGTFTPIWELMKNED